MSANIWNSKKILSFIGLFILKLNISTTYEDFKEIGLVPNKACLNSVSWIEIQVQDYCHNK